jgi:hypothetical protein
MGVFQKNQNILILHKGHKYTIASLSIFDVLHMIKLALSTFSSPYPSSFPPQTVPHSTFDTVQTDTPLAGYHR